MSAGRIFTPEYKARIVIEVLQERNTMSEIGAREDISPNQLGNWRREFINCAHRVFSTTRDERAANAIARAADEREQSLMAKIGQLTYELDWLKKKYDEHNKGRKVGNARR